MVLRQAGDGRRRKGFSQINRLEACARADIDYLQVHQSFPRHELFGLTSQIRRLAASVGANIAEGNALGSSANYLRHLNIAVSSLAETEYHLELAHDLGYLSDVDYSQIIDLAGEVGYLLSRLKASIERNTNQKP